MNQRGMSKIEILIIGAIIGILGVAAVVAVSSARSRMRDAVRMADVSQIQTALELHFIDHNSYPGASEATAIGTAATACLGSSGWASSCSAATGSIYLDVAPFTPTAGLKDASGCDGYSNAYCYLAEESAYRVSFELEHANPILELSKGLNCATETGLEPGPCSALPSASLSDSE